MRMIGYGAIAGLGLLLAGSATERVPPAPASLCTSSERVAFTCRAGAKIISLCASGDVLRYRFGKPGKTELAAAIDTFEAEGELRRIQATIFVDREGHKSIVIGEKGATLKRIGTEARLGMQDLFGAKVFLELWVKVKGGWADNEAIVREWGHG